MTKQEKIAALQGMSNLIYDAVLDAYDKAGLSSDTEAEKLALETQLAFEEQCDNLFAEA
jgi:hypothetical protein